VPLARFELASLPELTYPIRSRGAYGLEVQK